MSKAIGFAVRDSAGGTSRGAVAGEGGSTFIQLGMGEEISLNLSRESIAGYLRQGDDLLITLIDGRQIVLDGFFNDQGEPNQLYLSASGEVVPVVLSDAGDGTLFASYGAADGWDKFSSLDDLRFGEGDDLALAQAATDEPAGMAVFAPGLVGLGGAGAGLIGLGLIGGGGGGGGNGGGVDAPYVDNAASETTLMTETATPSITVTGGGEPGDSVQVTVGSVVVTTTIGTDGRWSVTIPEDDLPADGDYESVVVVTHAGGGSTTLDGPGFLIDMTPPAVDVTAGAQSTGDVENLSEYQNGVSISGVGEAGATITVQVGTHTQTTTVSSSGSWTVTFPTTAIAPGEYEIPFTVTATDAVGNDTVLNDVLVIDTVPHPVTFQPVTADNTVSGTENAAGFTITGSSTAGAVLSVTLQGVTQTVTVGSDGTWSATYAAGTLMPGEYQATVTVTTTDAAGNPTTASHSFAVDTTTSVAFAPGPITADNVVNATEAAGGVTMTGSSQPGSTVQVAWNGQTLAATVAADGSWTVTFPGAGIAGGTYSSTATVTATDAFGNTASATRTVQVDTETTVSVNAGQAGGDNVVSGLEQGGGLVLTGRAEAGATVRVTFEGVTRTVVADGSGNWSATWSAGEVRTGTYSSTVQVSATDVAGNVATTTHALQVDTEVVPLTRNTLSTGTDTVLNAAEATSGLTVTGTVEAGSTVLVTFGNGAAVAATVAADGTWTVTIPPGSIPAGENNVPMVVRATDIYGNVATISETVRVDTLVRNFVRTGGPVAGDGVINAEEAAAGLTLNGTVEPNSTVVVRLSNGQQVTVTAGSNGLWTATFAPAQLPAGEGNITVTMTATDPVGNVATLTESVAYDTVMPNTPEVISFSRIAQGLRGIGTALTDDSYSFTAIDASGRQTTIGSTRDDDTFYGETEFRLNQTVPDGSYLVIDTSDDAGNEVSTLLIVNNTTAVEVDLDRAGLNGFDFNAIDLTFAPEARLTITEADILDLTGPERELIVKGDSDDRVSLDDAVNTNASRTIDGQTYNIYTIGAGTVLVDEDIQTTIV